MYIYTSLIIPGQPRYELQREEIEEEEEEEEEECIPNDFSVTNNSAEIDFERVRRYTCYTFVLQF